MTLEDANYDVAIALLTQEFWDTPVNVDIFKQLLNTAPKYDSQIVNIKHFLSKTRADMPELKRSYNLNLNGESQFSPNYRIFYKGS